MNLQLQAAIYGLCLCFGIISSVYGAVLYEKVKAEKIYGSEVGNLSGDVVLKPDLQSGIADPELDIYPDDNIPQDNETLEFMGDDYQQDSATSLYCQRSLGLLHGATSGPHVIVTTSEGEADDVRLYAPKMWTVTSNNSDNWIQINFDEEQFVTGFMVRSDVTFGGRVEEFQVFWGEECGGLLDKDTVSRSAEYLVPHGHRSTITSVTTVLADEPLRVKCLVIFPYGDSETDELLSLQLELLGCGTRECSESIKASILPDTEEIGVNFHSEKVITRITFDVPEECFQEGFNGSVEVLSSRTCRTFFNTPVKKFSILDTSDVSISHRQIVIDLPDPIRTQCLKLNSSETSLINVGGTAMAIGCDHPTECDHPGVQHKHAHHVQKRIVGGQPVTRAQYPWLVSMRFDGFHPFMARTPHNFSHLCGGSLIHPYWVLSASHCFSNKTHPGLGDISQWTAVLGEHTLLGDEETTEVYRVEKCIQPGELNYNSPLTKDIALLKLKEPVPLSSYARSVCIDYIGEDTDGSQCVIVGWGAATGEYMTGANNVPLQATIPTISQDECRFRYSNLSDDHPAKNWALIDDGVLCAAHEDGGKDTCPGDSGGPFLCFTNDIWTLVGITSGGYKCGMAEYPGVYTRIKHYMEWIKTTVAEN